MRRSHLTDARSPVPHPYFRLILAGLRLGILFGLLCAVTLWAGIERHAALEGGWGLGHRLPAPAADGAAAPFLGATVQLEQYTPPERAAALDRLAAAGFSWARQRFDWGEIEPKPGQYDWSRSDAILDAVAVAGLAPVVVLDGSPAWARSPLDTPPHDNPLAPPADPATFARFATAFAQRYGERVRYYQIWDEPNVAPHWGNRLIEPVAYSQLLRAASQAIRSVDSDAVIIAAALAPTGDRGHTAIDEIYFLQRMVAAGAAPYFDVVGLQPFGFGHSPRYPWQAIETLDFQRTVLLRRALVAAGLGEKPVWIARFGWNTDPNSPWGVVTPDDQATYTIDALTIGRNEWPWLAAMGWAIDRPAAPTHDPMWGFALVDPEEKPLPVFEAIRAWSAGVALAGPHPSQSASAAPDAVAAVTWLLILAAVAVIIWRGAAAARVIPWPSWLAAYRRSPWWFHVVAWTVLLATYFVATWPPLIVFCWLLGGLLCVAEPFIGLALAALLLPFYYQHKELYLVNATLAVAPASALALCLLPALTLALRRATRNRPFTIHNSPFIIHNSLFVSLFLISLCSAVNVWQWPAYSVGLAELVLVPLVLWAAAMMLATNDTQRRRLVAALFLGGTLAALWGIISWMQGEGVAADGVRRLVGPHYSPNHTALYLIRTLFVGVGLFLALLPRRGDGGVGRQKRHDMESSDVPAADGSRRPHRLQHVVVLAGLAVVLAALVLTGSRGALLLGLPAGVLTMGWLALWRRPGLLRWLRMRPGQVGIILVVLFVGTGVVIGFQWDRLANLRTILLRVDLWKAALRLWRDHLLVGVGPGGFFWNYPAYLSPDMQVEPDQLHPHNVWLEVATTWGLLGLVWLAAGLIVLLRQGRTLIRLPSAAFWVAAGVSAALVAAIAHAQIDSFFLLADLAAWNAMAVAILLTTMSSKGLSSTKKT